MKLPLDALIALSGVVCARIFAFGGADLLGGRHIPGLPGMRLSCHKPGRPFLILSAAVFLRLALSAPAHLPRLIRWARLNIRTLSLAALVAATAATPRLRDLGGHSLAPDELLWIGYGQRFISHLRVREFRKATMHLSYPGVIPAAITGASYCYLGKGTTAYSRDLLDPLIAVRLPVACIGVATCALLFLLARPLIGDAAAFWGAVFLALLPGQIADSRVALVDAVLTPFLMGSVLCYAVGTVRARPRWRTASAILWAGAMLTKDPACLVPIILLAWKAAARLRGGRGRFRFLETGDLAWLGIGGAVFLLLYTKLWCDPRSLEWRDYSKFLPMVRPPIRAIERVARIPLLPAAGRALGAILLICSAWRGARARLRASWASARPAARGAAILLLAVAFVAAFHTALVNELLHLAGSYRLGNMGHLKYWMGRTTIYPPAWFYLFMLLVCTPPFILIFLAAGVARSIAAVSRRGSAWPGALLLLVAPAVYLAFMSRGHKMAIRYADSILPFLCALAASGLAGAMEAVGRAAARRAAPAARAALPLAAALAVAAFLLPPLFATAPEYDLYCNALIGGPPGAARLISIGFGAGMKDAVRYLKAHASDGDAVFVVGFHPEFLHHWEHDPPWPGPRVLMGRPPLPHVDWLVVPLGHRMRGLADGALSRVPRRALADVVKKCGVTVVEIYRVKDPPHSSPQRYGPPRLPTECGARVADPASPTGEALGAAGRMGTLTYGPFERYAAGAWRATFSLASGPAAPDAAVGRLSVTGVSPEETVQSAALRRRDFAGADGYRDFAVDFRIERDSRLQFRVEASGEADLRVGEVRVEPRKPR